MIGVTDVPTFGLKAEHLGLRLHSTVYKLGGRPHIMLALGRHL